MIAVIAGNHGQYIDWCRAHSVSTRIACYITNGLDFRAGNVSSIVFTGTYADLPGIEEIKNLCSELLTTEVYDGTDR